MDALRLVSTLALTSPVKLKFSNFTFNFNLIAAYVLVCSSVVEPLDSLEPALVFFFFIIIYGDN